MFDAERTTTVQFKMVCSVLYYVGKLKLGQIFKDPLISSGRLWAHKHLNFVQSKFNRKFTWNHLAEANAILYQNPPECPGLQRLDLDKLLQATSIANRTEKKYQNDIVSSLRHGKIAHSKNKTTSLSASPFDSK